MKLQGRVAVITGGARGIGAAAARLFAAEGAALVLGDIADEAGQSLAAELNANGGRAAYYHCDVRRADEVEALIQGAITSFDGLDCLVNNAGIAPAIGTLETTLADWDNVISLNLTAPWLCAKAAIPHMIKRGGGTIINLASTAGLVGFPNLAAYCASKGGLVQLTRAMALDCAKHHIRVNAVCPGHTRTPMGDGFIGAQADPQAFVRDFINVQHPIGRMAEADEVAQVIFFLACDYSSFMTGAIVPVDGGYTAR